ncbi:MAG: hypothetical protein ACAI25_05830 [Planctomycetota bacterium]
MSDEVIRTLLREAELGADPAVWQQLARELIRAGRLDEAGRAIARVPDLVARGPLLDAVAPRLDALRLREVKLPTRLGGVLSLAWAPDEESLYVGDEKRVLAVSVASGAILRTFDEARVAACSPRGDEVATGSPFTVTAFAASEARSLGSERHDDMAFGPDGDTLVGVTLGDLTSDGQVTLLSRSASGGWTKRLVDFDGRVAHLDSTGAFVTISGEKVSLHDPTTGLARAIIDVAAHIETPAVLTGITREAVSSILRAFRVGSVIQAIKEHRAATSLGLKESKEAIEKVETWHAVRALGARLAVLSATETLLFDHAGTLLMRAAGGPTRYAADLCEAAPSGRVYARFDRTWQYEPHDLGESPQAPRRRASIDLRDLLRGEGTSFSVDIASADVPWRDSPVALAWSPSGRRLAAVGASRVAFLEPGA